MTRLRLFLFYSLMAWASVIRPAEGTKMIEAAEAGVAVRGGNVPRVDGPSNSTLALAATVALLVTGGWLALIIDAAIGWLQ